jgi:hypothetical protein
MQTFKDVNTYLLYCAEGIPEAMRPKCCIHCLASTRLHRHGKFFRTVFSLQEEHSIPIFRFYCPLCERCCSYLPDFLEPHQQVALDVQEEILEIRDKQPLSTVTELTRHLPGGYYAEKTLWRWTKKWNGQLQMVEPKLWEWLFQADAHIRLPRGLTGWTAWRSIWKQLRIPTGRTPLLLRKIAQLFRSLSLTERVENPTKPVHGIPATAPSQ